MDGALSGSWVAARYGLDPRQVEAMRRAGELLALWRDGDHVYPAWQFGPRGPRPEVAAIVRGAREEGLTDEELARLLDDREGLTGTRRLRDALRDGDAEHVLAAIRARAAGRRG
jgi:hypothetical protein